MGKGGTFPVGFCGIGDMWKVGRKFLFLVKWKCWDRVKKERGRGSVSGWTLQERYFLEGVRQRFCFFLDFGGKMILDFWKERNRVAVSGQFFREDDFLGKS